MRNSRKSNPLYALAWRICALSSVIYAFAIRYGCVSRVGGTPTTSSVEAHKSYTQTCTIRRADTTHPTALTPTRAIVIDQMQFSSRSRLPEQGRGMAAETAKTHARTNKERKPKSQAKI
jgi:hypothetical protein